MKTVFLLTHVPDPRINKRIRVLSEQRDIGVVCVRRSKEDIWEPTNPDVTYHIHSTNYPPSSKPIRRGLATLRFAFFAFNRLSKEKPDLIYTGSLDTLLIAWLFCWLRRNVKIALEIADIRESFLVGGRGIRTKIINVLERVLYKRVCLLVLTSDLFYDKYYHRFFNMDKVVILPNVPETHVFVTYKKREVGPFTVGFIGGIRYITQMKMLVDASESIGVQVIFAGAGGSASEQEEILEYCKDKKHVQFTGKYDYDRDIAKLYGMVDCIYSVYDADNPNVRIALPNKYYEALYCQLPILVAKGTYLAKKVLQNKVGIAVSHTDTKELASALKDLSQDLSLRQELSNNCKAAWDQEVSQASSLSMHLGDIFPDRINSELNL